jgi:hypothetical protein
MGKTEKGQAQLPQAGQEEAGKQQSWADTMKELGGGNFTFLSSDGETITFIIVGSPVPITTMYNKVPQQRIGWPVVTEDGFQLFICGKRPSRKLAKLEREAATHAIMVVRHGAEGDSASKYPVTVLPETETFKKLSAIASEEYNPDMIAEAVAEAQKALGT